MITKTEFKNLKGHTGKHKLGKLTLITGPNDAGKTTIPDAIKLALLGYLPGHPKTNQGTADLAGGSTMSVAIALANGLEVSRAWTRKGAKVTTTTEGAELLPAFPLAMLEAEEYFGKSDAARVQMVFDLLDMDALGFTLAEIHTGATTIEGVTLTDEATDLLDVVEGETLQGWIDRVTDGLADQQKAANAVLKRFEQTQTGITQLQAGDTAPVDAGQVDADRAGVARELETLVEQRTRLKTATDEATTLAARRSALVQHIATLKGGLPAGELTPKAELDKAAAELSRNLETATADHARAMQTAQQLREQRERREQLTERKERLERLAATLPEKQRLQDENEGALANLPQRDVRALTTEWNTASQAVARLQDEARRIERERTTATATHDRLAQATACPTCGSEGHDWKQALADKHTAAMADLSAQQRKVESDYRQAQEAADNAQNALAAAQADERQRQTFERDLGELKLRVMEAKQAAATLADMKAELAAMPDPSTAPDTSATLDALNAVKTRAAQVERELCAHTTAERIAEREEELAALPSPDATLPDQLTAIEATISAKRARLDELATKQQQAANQLADARRLAQASEERAAKEKEVAGLKTVREHIAGVKERMIQEAFKPLMASANQFTKGILDTPLEFRDGEIGRFRGPNWVPVRCFGGTHLATAHAAIQAALSAQSGLKLVIIDELGRFADDNLAKLLANVRDAIEAGTIEQFIGVDWKDRQIEVPGKKGGVNLTLIQVRL